MCDGFIRRLEKRILVPLPSHLDRKNMMRAMLSPHIASTSSHPPPPPQYPSSSSSNSPSNHVNDINEEVSEKQNGEEEDEEEDGEGSGVDFDDMSERTQVCNHIFSSSSS